MRPIKYSYLGKISENNLDTTIMYDISKITKNGASWFLFLTFDPYNGPHTQTLQILRIFPCCASIFQHIEPENRKIDQKIEFWWIFQIGTLKKNTLYIKKRSGLELELWGTLCQQKDDQRGCYLLWHIVYDQFSSDDYRCCLFF